MTDLIDCVSTHNQLDMEIELPDKSSSPPDQLLRSRSEPSSKEHAKIRSDGCGTSIHLPDDNGREEAKEKTSRRQTKKKFTSVAPKNETDLFNYGHILVPKIVEFMQLMHKIPEEQLDPSYAKNSPLSKNHFNAHIYWYLISSVYMPRTLSKFDGLSAKALLKTLGGLKGSEKLGHFLGKLRKCESREVMRKRAAEALCDEKLKGSFKCAVSKKAKQVKAIEAVESYVRLKQDMMQVGALWSVKVENETGTDSRLNIDEKEAENEPIMDSKIENSNTAMEGQAPNFPSQPETIQELADRPRDITIGSQDWREFGQKPISSLIKLIQIEKDHTSERIEQLLQLSEARRADHETSWKRVSLVPNKKQKRDISNLFANTIKENDVLYHCRSFLKIEKKYLELLDDDTKKQLPNHMVGSDAAKSEFKSVKSERCRSILRGGRMSCLQLGRVYRSEPNRVLRGEFIRVATYLCTRSVTG